MQAVIVDSEVFQFQLEWHCSWSWWGDEDAVKSFWPTETVKIWISIGSYSSFYSVIRTRHYFTKGCFQMMFFSQNLFLFTCLITTALAISSPSADSISPKSPKYNSPPMESSRTFSQSSSSFYPAASSPLDRTIDLSALGIDLGSIFDRLLSPAGIVQQFLLTLTLGKYQM